MNEVDWREKRKNRKCFWAEDTANKVRFNSGGLKVLSIAVANGRQKTIQCAVGIRKTWKHFSYRFSSPFSKDQSNWVNWQHFQPIELSQPAALSANLKLSQLAALSANQTESTEQSQLAALSVNQNWVNWQNFQSREIESTGSTFSQSKLSQLAALPVNRTESHHYQPIETESTDTTFSQSNWPSTGSTYSQSK